MQIAGNSIHDNDDLAINSQNDGPTANDDWDSDRGWDERLGRQLALAARAHAFLARRAFVLPEDVKEVAPDVLRHRLSLHWEAEAEGATPDAVIGQLLASVRIP